MVDSTPPIAQPMRYGNKAFRKWHDSVVERAPAFVAHVLGVNNLEQKQSSCRISLIRLETRRASTMAPGTLSLDRSLSGQCSFSESRALLHAQLNVDVKGTETTFILFLCELLRCACPVLPLVRHPCWLSVQTASWCLAFLEKLISQLWASVCFPCLCPSCAQTATDILPGCATAAVVDAAAPDFMSTGTMTPFLCVYLNYLTRRTCRTGGLPWRVEPG